MFSVNVNDTEMSVTVDEFERMMVRFVIGSKKGPIGIVASINKFLQTKFGVTFSGFSLPEMLIIAGYYIRKDTL